MPCAWKLTRCGAVLVAALLLSAQTGGAGQGSRPLTVHCETRDARSVSYDVGIFEYQAVLR